MRTGTTKDKAITDAVRNLKTSICGDDGDINKHLTKIDIYDMTSEYKMFIEWLRYIPNADDRYYMDGLFQIAMELSWITGPTLGTDIVVNDDIMVNIFADELRSVTHKDVMDVNNVDIDYVAVEILRTINRVISYSWPSKNIMVIYVPLLWVWDSNRVTLHIGVVDDTCSSNES